MFAITGVRTLTLTMSETDICNMNERIEEYTDKFQSLLLFSQHLTTHHIAVTLQEVL